MQLHRIVGLDPRAVDRVDPMRDQRELIGPRSRSIR